MPIQQDFEAIFAYAKQTGWRWGDPLRNFTFCDPPPGGYATYAAMFSQWRVEADRRGDLYQYLYAIGYVYAVYLLRNDQEKVPDDQGLSVSWLRKIGLPYPEDQNHYGHLEKGLKSHFGHWIPKNNQQSRMFLTGIGRESGYYYPCYANVLRTKVIQQLDHNWQRVVNDIEKVTEIVEQPPPIISISKIPADQGVRDYSAIARLFSKIAELQLAGRLTSGNLAEVADHLGVCESIARQIIAEFLPPGVSGSENVAGEQLQLAMNAQGKVTLSLPREVIFNLPPAANDCDVFLAVERNGKLVNSTVFYRRGPVWKCGQLFTELLKERDDLQIMRSYRLEGGDSVNREYITPEGLQQPLVFFDSQGRWLPSGISKLVPHQDYRLFRTSRWEDSFSVWLRLANRHPQRVDIDGWVSTIHPSEETEAVVVRDSAGNDIQEILCKGRSVLDFSFGETNLETFIPGKRGFRSPPTVAYASVSIIKEIVVSQEGKEIIKQTGEFALPIDLSKLWPVDERANSYGVFEVKLSMNGRQGTRRFSLLPEDFKHNLLEVLPMGEAGVASFQSEAINQSDGRHDVVLSATQDRLEATIEFKSGWHLPFRGPVQRRGACVVSANQSPVVFGSDPVPVLNLDDVMTDGVFIIAGVPDCRVSIRVSNAAGRKKGENIEKANTKEKVKEYIFESCRCDGYARYPFRQLIKDVGYDRLISCDELSVKMRLLKEDLKFRVRLQQFSDKRPDPVIGGDQLVDCAQEIPVPDKALKRTHPVSVANREPAPYLVLLPVGQQDCAQPLALAPAGRPVPDWCQRVADNLEISYPSESTNLGLFTLANWPDVMGVPAPGYIGFIMGGDVDNPRRLSAGFYLTGDTTADMDDWTKAFVDRDLPAIEKLLGQNDGRIRSYIEGIYRNALRLDAFHFLNSFHGLAVKDPSGYAFRASWYWLELIFNDWCLSHDQKELTQDSKDRISLVERYWDEELFGYQDGKASARNMRVNVTLLTNRFNQQGGTSRFSSWPLTLQWLLNATHPDRLPPELLFQRRYLVEEIKNKLAVDPWCDYLQGLARIYFAADLTQLADIYNFDWGIPTLPEVKGFSVLGNNHEHYLSRLGYRLHQWRMNPAIGIESNRLRDELQRAGKFMPAMKSLAVVWSLIYAWNDPTFQELRKQ